jgi:uncharacterized protein with HEPN domain
MKKDDLVYLRHILDATRRIEGYMRGIERPGFMQNDLVQDGVIRQLEIIGEATKHVSSDLKSRYPEIPWKDVAGMRDKLIKRCTQVQGCHRKNRQTLGPRRVSHSLLSTTLSENLPGVSLLAHIPDLCFHGIIGHEGRV